MVEHKNLSRISLMEDVINKIKEGTSPINISIPQPIEKVELDNMKFSNGKPLPPSLIKFLAFDASWLKEHYNCIDGSFISVDIDAVLTEKLDAPYFNILPYPLIDDPEVVPLDVDKEEGRISLLYLDNPDENGEYPVLSIHVDVSATIELNACGFDVWLAQKAGFIENPLLHFKKETDETIQRVIGKNSLKYRSWNGKSDVAEIMYNEKIKKSERERSGVKLKPIAPEKLENLSENELENALIEGIETKDKNYYLPILYCLKKRFPKESGWKNRALQVSVYDNYAFMVGEVLALGANPAYNNVLILACKNKDIEIIAALLKHGADSNLKPSWEDDNTPLITACKYRRPDVVKLLLEYKADPNLCRNITPLLEASWLGTYNSLKEVKNAQEKSPVIIKLLVEAGAKIEIKNNRLPKEAHLVSALHNAVLGNNLEAVKYLVSKGADINLADHDGNTPIMKAWRLKYDEIFTFLLKAKSRTDIKNSYGVCLDDLMLRNRDAKRLTAKLDVKLYESEIPQTIHLKLKAPSLPSHNNWILFLDALCLHGLSGSDQFRPQTNRLEWEGEITHHGHYSSFEGKLGLNSVSKSAFSFFVLNLFHELQVMELYMVADEIAGEKYAITTETVTNWIKSNTPEPYKIWGSLNIPIIEAFKKLNTICFIKLKKDTDSNRIYLLRMGLMYIEHLTEFLTLREVNSNIIFKSQIKGNTVTLSYDFNNSKDSEFNCDIEQIKAMIMNCLASNSEDGCVESMEWSLGVAETSEASSPGTEFSGTDKLEFSPNNRSSCKTCKQKIENGVIRFAKVAGGRYEYHHLECAVKPFKRQLAKAIEEYPDDFEGKSDLINMIAKTPDIKKYPYAELAKTGKSSCIACGGNIEKGTLRIAIERKFKKSAGTKGTGPGYLHIECAKNYKGEDLLKKLKNLDDLNEIERGLLDI